MSSFAPTPGASTSTYIVIPMFPYHFNKRSRRRRTWNKAGVGVRTWNKELWELGLEIGLTGTLPIGWLVLMRLGKGGLRRLEREEAGQGRQPGKREREGGKGWKTTSRPMGRLSCTITSNYFPIEELSL
jgi:hypothetical protein